MSYDLEEVSPRPWKGPVWEDHTEFKINDANGEFVLGSAGFRNYLEYEDVAHIVHCVNAHDRLKPLASLVPGLVDALANATRELNLWLHEMRDITRSPCPLGSDFDNLANLRDILAEARKVMDDAK